MLLPRAPTSGNPVQVSVFFLFDFHLHFQFTNFRRQIEKWAPPWLQPRRQTEKKGIKINKAKTKYGSISNSRPREEVTRGELLFGGSIFVVVVRAIIEFRK